MCAGNFEDYELSFLSTEIQERVTLRFMEKKATNLAALIQLTEHSSAEVHGASCSCLQLCMLVCSYDRT